MCFCSHSLLKQQERAVYVGQGESRVQGKNEITHFVAQHVQKVRSHTRTRTHNAHTQARWRCYCCSLLILRSLSLPCKSCFVRNFRSRLLLLLLLQKGELSSQLELSVYLNARAQNLKEYSNRNSNSSNSISGREIQNKSKHAKKHAKHIYNANPLGRVQGR